MGSYPLSSQAPTHVEVELGCDNMDILVQLPLSRNSRCKECEFFQRTCYLSEHFSGKIVIKFQENIQNIYF